MSLIITSLMAAALAAPPTRTYRHAYVGADGLSRQADCRIESFELKGVTKGVTPQWLAKMSDRIEKVSITTQPVGWIGDWHENPGPQWIVPLSGRWFVETSDGRRVEMGPGDISLGEDQNSAVDARGHRGHLSGTLGKEPATLIIVSLKEPPTRNEPCHFK